MNYEVIDKKSVICFGKLKLKFDEIRSGYIGSGTVNEVTESEKALFDVLLKHFKEFKDFPLSSVNIFDSRFEFVSGYAGIGDRVIIRK